jgi:CRP-like cAMP-binding protein
MDFLALTNYYSMFVMIEILIDRIRCDEKKRAKFERFFVEKEIGARHILLHEGEIASTIFFVKKGCLRMWFNKDGKDITMQFFFENQCVASIESFVSQQPSLFSIESIEPTTFISISKQDFEILVDTYPELRYKFQEKTFQRFRNYATLFLSRIKDTPQERYNDLLKSHPEIIQRVPQHYIASYLGITPISLSRIRNRK